MQLNDAVYEFKFSKLIWRYTNKADPFCIQVKSPLPPLWVRLATDLLFFDVLYQLSDVQFMIHNLMKFILGNNIVYYWIIGESPLQ